MNRKALLTCLLSLAAPFHVVAVPQQRWVADYLGGAQLTNIYLQTFGPLTIHAEFVPEFKPTPNTTIQSESVSFIDFLVPGAPSFAAPWGGATLMFQLKLDGSLSATNWWVTQTVYLGGAPAATNYQVAGTYRDGADGEGFWDTAFVMDASGNYVTTCTSQALTANGANTVNFPAWDVEVADPV